MSLMIVNSQQTLSQAIGDIREAWAVHKFLKISVKTGKDRSLDQNAISHAWYEQVANELREGSALDVKCECKLVCGVPILRAEDNEFREFYDKAIRKALTYEEKLSAMKFFPITSIMTVSQLSQYLVAVQAHYKNRVELLFPPSDNA